MATPQPHQGAYNVANALPPIPPGIPIKHASVTARPRLEDALMLEDYKSSVARLAKHFCHLVVEGRGDSARGRNFHTLYFLDFVWSQPHLPLHRYRPGRNPAAFLALVFDLLGDHLYGYSQAVLEHDMASEVGSRRALRHDVERRLNAPWFSFMTEVAAAKLPYLSLMLDSTIKAALLRSSRSKLPAYLRRLRLYMTTAQLAQLEVNALIDNLSVAEVLAYLSFVGTQGQGEERHPAGGDLRKAIRTTFDAAWSRVVERQGEHDLVTFFASLPVDGLWLIEMSGAAQEVVTYDFAVFYARITDAPAPGRLWQPPSAYVGGSEDAWQHFAFLAAREAQDSLSRRVHGLARLGLSHTFPMTFRALDAWLGHEDSFQMLHAHQPWGEAVERVKDRIAQARAHLLAALALELLGAVDD